MNDPIKTMLDNKAIIMKIYEEEKGPKTAWETLKEKAPRFQQEMSFNTFKQYYSAFCKINSYKSNNIDGWSICKDKKGYHRGVRRIKGKLTSIYLGKEFDREKFAAKIASKTR